MRNPFRYFNSSPEVIRLAVMMYVRYPLSLRQVEDLLFERGIDVCHETVRYWWNRFGPLFAGEIRRRRVGRRNWSNWRWHLDEVCVRINGETHYLWRAVDHEGEVLEVFVTKRRDRRAALKFLKHAMKRYGRPGSIVTDRLRSYRAAMNAIGNAAAQTCGRWLNNRAENSHQPFRRREGAMARFRDLKTLQKFAAVHASIHNHSHGEMVSQGRDQFALRMVFLRGYGIQVRAPFGDTALRRAGQAHIRSPVAPAAPTSRFRRWRLRRTGPQSSLETGRS